MHVPIHFMYHIILGLRRISNTESVAFTICVAGSNRRVEGRRGAHVHDRAALEALALRAHRPEHARDQRHLEQHRARVSVTSTPLERASASTVDDVHLYTCIEVY